MEQFKLSTEEEERIRANGLNRRRGFIGVVHFHNGPRGGRYRSIRTQAQRNLDQAVEATDKLAGRNWKQDVRDTEVFAVNINGFIQEDE